MSALPASSLPGVKVVGDPSDGGSPPTTTTVVLSPAMRMFAKRMQEEKSMRSCRPVHLQFHNVTFTVDATDMSADGHRRTCRRDILQSVAGEVRPGELLAVMGPSGSGKTTLLNALSGRLSLSTDGVVTGSVLVNGQPRHKSLKRITGFVAQDDILFPNLTVRETLRYQALLRCPRSMTRPEKLAHADRLLDLLRLTRCADTRIGGPMIRGISGGERKRVCIACELLTNPSLLLLDEPTSGLDSSSALFLLEVLKSLASEGRTVITTIHQPSSQMVALFDRILLLSEGQCVYFGSHVVDDFAAVGFPCPIHWNPADFFIELLSECDDPSTAGIHDVQTRRRMLIEANVQRRQHNSAGPHRGHLTTSQRLSVLNVDSEDDVEGIELAQIQIGHGPDGSAPVATAAVLTATSSSSSPTAPSTTAVVGIHVGHDSRPETNGGGTTSNRVTAMKNLSASIPSYSRSKWQISWFEQFMILTHRSFVQKRGECVAALTLIQIVALSLFSGLIWYQTDRSEENLEDRVGFYFFSAVFFGFFSLFNALTSFPPERIVLMKERSAGSYRLSAYFMAKMVSEIPLELTYPSIYVVITYWMVGLNDNADRFFLFWAVMLVQSLTAQSIGLMISSAVLSIKNALTIASISMLTTMLAGGFYVDQRRIPPFFNWVQYLSFVKYTFEAFSQVDLGDDGVFFKCAKERATIYGSCPKGPINGHDVLVHLSLSKLSVGENLAILAGFLFISRFLSYLCLRYLHRSS